MRLPTRTGIAMLLLLALFILITEYGEFSKNVSQGHSNRSSSKYAAQRLHGKIHTNPRGSGTNTRNKVVIVMAYLRGGSSFLGRLLSMNPEVFYWYEPLADIYNSFSMARLMTLTLHVLYKRDGSPRKMTKIEHGFIKKQLWKIFDCDFLGLPVEMLGSWSTIESPCLQRYRRCLMGDMKHIRKEWKINAPVEELCQDKLQDKCPVYVGESMEWNCHVFMEAAHLLLSNGSVTIKTGVENLVRRYVGCLRPIVDASQKCIPLMQKPCINRRIKAVKIVRLRLENLEDLIIQNHRDDVDIYIIHELRDPRGIIASRKKDHRLTKKVLAAEARMLCQKMLEDILARQRLSRMYENVFMDIHYEDLADSPLDVAKDVYSHIYEKFPTNVQQWVWQNTHSEKDGNAFSEKRRNSSATARAWMSRLTKQEKRDIMYECKDLLKAARYTL